MTANARQTSHLMKWNGAYWLVGVWTPPQRKVPISAGDRPLDPSLGFIAQRHGPFDRPEDINLPPSAPRRHDHYITWYYRTLTRQIAAESVFYEQIRWRGLAAEIGQWADPHPHGEKLHINIFPESFASFMQRQARIAGTKDLSDISSPENNVPVMDWNRHVLEHEGWFVTDDRSYINMASKAMMIRDMELIEGP